MLAPSHTRASRARAARRSGGGASVAAPYGHRGLHAAVWLRDDDGHGVWRLRSCHAHGWHSTRIMLNVVAIP